MAKSVFQKQLHEVHGVKRPDWYFTDEARGILCYFGPFSFSFICTPPSFTNDCLVSQIKKRINLILPVFLLLMHNNKICTYLVHIGVNVLTT